MIQPNSSVMSKIFISSLMILSFGCGSKDQAATLPQVESSPITAGEGTEQQTIRLGQPVIQLEMNHDEMEAIFETRDIPAVCTRTVQRGSRRDCHIENQQQCRNVPFPVCTTHTENVCRNVPDQVCHTQSIPVCQSVQKCETVNDRVCRGTPPNQTCTTIPRRVCHVEQSCHQESRQVCEQITRRECHQESSQQCHQENRQECTNLPQQVCVDVPIIVQEQYACTRQQQVQVGERLRLHQLARIQLDLVNPRGVDVSRDEIMITMNQGMISAVVRSNSGIRYQIRERARFVRRISATEELINVTLDVVVMF